MKELMMKLPLRPRAALVLLSLLLLCWVPFLIAVERMWNENGMTLQDIYGQWWELMQGMAKALWTGKEVRWDER